MFRLNRDVRFSHDTLIDDLKRKSLIVRHGLTEREVTGTKLLDRIVERAADTKPLLAWSCRALDLPF